MVLWADITVAPHAQELRQMSDNRGVQFGCGNSTSLQRLQHHHNIQDGEHAINHSHFLASRFFNFQVAMKDWHESQKFAASAAKRLVFVVVSVFIFSERVLNVGR